MKKYLILMAGIVIAFQACKKSTSSTPPPPGAPVACFSVLHPIIDSGQVDSFNASCSQNASSYAWLSTSDGGTGSSETWTKYFIHRSSTTNSIKLTVTNSAGAKKDTTIGVICGFHQYKSFTITKLPSTLTDSFYIGYGSINGATADVTKAYSPSSLPITIPLASPITVSAANRNNGQWIIHIYDAITQSPIKPFVFTDNATLAPSPYQRSFSITGTDVNFNIKVNYTISAN